MLLEHDELVGEHDLGEVVQRRAGQQKRLEMLAFEEAVLEAVDLGVLDERRRRADLLVVADHQHLASAQQRRHLADVGLRGLVHDDEVEGAELSRQLLGDAPGRHDPAGDRAIALRHRGARVAPVPDGAFAGAPAGPPQGRREHHQGGADRARHRARERVERPLPHQPLEGARAVALEADPFARQRLEPVAPLDPSQITLGRGPVPGEAPIGGNQGVGAIACGLGQQPARPCGSSRLPQHGAHGGDRREVLAVIGEIGDAPEKAVPEGSGPLGVDVGAPDRLVQEVPGERSELAARGRKQGGETLHLRFGGPEPRRRRGAAQGALHRDEAVAVEPQGAGVLSAEDDFAERLVEDRERGRSVDEYRLQDVEQVLQRARR